MVQAGYSQRLLETTRGRILSLLRCEPRTVEEMASALGLTDNAVRAHLTTLERDGLVRAAGVRRGPGAGKPATVYELPPEAEVGFSHAYAPVLTALLEELVAQLPTERTAALLDGLGRRLAAPLLPPGSASRTARIQAATAVLNALGGSATLEETPGGGAVIRGCGCPLSATVAQQPETCRAVETLVTEIVGADVRQHCRHGDRPSCCFEIAPASASAPASAPKP
ncbi:MAG TPA: helix-turn-helix domain-containing protein [Gemmatimonadales bacterium]|nr:helix-turn-helix domain-containing protein [Gemmatimonadales bacterium]